MTDECYIIGCSDEDFGDMLCEDCRGNEPHSNECNKIRDEEDHWFLYGKC